MPQPNCSHNAWIGNLFDLHHAFLKVWPLVYLNQYHRGCLLKYIHEPCAISITGDKARKSAFTHTHTQPGDPQALYHTLEQKLFECAPLGLPDGKVVKNRPTNAGDTGNGSSVPGWGRSPEVGNGNPLQDSCLGNSMDRGAWWAIAPRVSKSWTRLNTHPPLTSSISLSIDPGLIRNAKSWPHPLISWIGHYGGGAQQSAF